MFSNADVQMNTILHYSVKTLFAPGLFTDVIRFTQRSLQRKTG
jgi:hypothetical protein